MLIDCTGLSTRTPSHQVFAAAPAPRQVSEQRCIRQWNSQYLKPVETYHWGHPMMDIRNLVQRTWKTKGCFLSLCLAQTAPPTGTPAPSLFSNTHPLRLSLGTTHGDFLPKPSPLWLLSVMLRQSLIQITLTVLSIMCCTILPVAIFSIRL